MKRNIYLKTIPPAEEMCIRDSYYLVLVSFATWFLQKLERKFAMPGFGKK